MNRLLDDYGGMAERFKAPVLKTGDPQGSVGSNPTPSAMLFPLERRSQWQVTDGAGDVPIAQSEPADALLNVHLVGNTRPGEAIRQGFCGVRFCQVDPEDSHRIPGTGGEVFFFGQVGFGGGRCGLRTGDRCRGTGLLGQHVPCFLERGETRVWDYVHDRPGVAAV
jgi:hypothetical protein